MFALCSATDSFDIAEFMFDGDTSEPNYEAKIDFRKTLAFELCTNSQSNYIRVLSIDMTRKHK